MIWSAQKRSKNIQIYWITSQMDKKYIKPCQFTHFHTVRGWCRSLLWHFFIFDLCMLVCNIYKSQKWTNSEHYFSRQKCEEKTVHHSFVRCYYLQCLYSVWIYLYKTTTKVYFMFSVSNNVSVCQDILIVLKANPCCRISFSSTNLCLYGGSLYLSSLY